MLKHRNYLRKQIYSKHTWVPLDLWCILQLTTRRRFKYLHISVYFQYNTVQCSFFKKKLPFKQYYSSEDIIIFLFMAQYCSLHILDEINQAIRCITLKAKAWLIDSVQLPTRGEIHTMHASRNLASLQHSTILIQYNTWGHTHTWLDLAGLRGCSILRVRVQG